MDVVGELKSKRLCFTVTSGRSGTKLLTELLRRAAGICAEHEPAPRFNYVLRAVLESPDAARWWLLTEKLPAIVQRIGSVAAYAELSHLTCKGFIEPLLESGLSPAFIILSRPARNVATSLYRIGAIPERTGAGRLVLISPRHSRFLALDDWEQLTDYQLCYWYAREIELRQVHYRSMFTDLGLGCFELPFSEIGNWDSFASVADFVSKGDAIPDRGTFDAIMEHNQNSRANLLDGAAERPLPSALDAEERHVDELIAAFIERQKPELRAA